jgi:hypothetical protein
VGRFRCEKTRPLPSRSTLPIFFTTRGAPYSYFGELPYTLRISELFACAR